MVFICYAYDVSEHMLYRWVWTIVYCTPYDGCGKCPKHVHWSCNKTKILVLHFVGLYIYIVLFWYHWNKLNHKYSNLLHREIWTDGPTTLNRFQFSHFKVQYTDNIIKYTCIFNVGQTRSILIRTKWMYVTRLQNENTSQLMIWTLRLSSLHAHTW
jgi:hypothetical protein